MQCKEFGDLQMKAPQGFFVVYGAFGRGAQEGISGFTRARQIKLRDACIPLCAPLFSSENEIEPEEEDDSTDEDDNKKNTQKKY
ncbi:hypothetical protein EVAR_23323_1 [Eumeta japonica]|uniref:Uncharacterized protein n=1 Tax=Eumeta variegata TaxID=151549 RepID=A0A4C1Y031_EUMVA|nr:hypothetical protein EVAR_23323_1 [Eumeta japonica]